MSVERSETSDLPATLTVFFGKPRTSKTLVETLAQRPVDSQSSSELRTETIDMQHKHEQDIWDELARITKAQAHEPTDAEQEEMRVLEEQQRRSEHEAKLQKAVVAKRKREQEILEMARKSVEAQAAP